MKVFAKTGIILLFLLLLHGSVLGARMDSKNILVLTYHHITTGPITSPDTNTQKTLAQQIEFLRTHGYHFVSVEDLIKAAKGRKVLPSKPVLLTFDDAYVSFYNFVLPLLKELHCPAMVAVVGHWIDHPPLKYLVAPLMTWKQLRDVSKSGWVEVASHTYNLHHSVQYTPQGNVTAAVAALQYFPGKHRYETVEEYRRRIRQDFEHQKTQFIKKLGIAPRVLVWPYGRYNKIALKIAKRAGMFFTFSTEEGLNSLDDLQQAGKRFYIEANLASMDRFISFIELKELPDQHRVAQVDLDLIYDPHSPKQTDKNLGRLIDRLVALGVDTVFLQAFADPDGDGIVKSVYFPNHYLPVRADIFGHACHQIMIRGINVYAWMPTLGIQLPKKERKKGECVYIRTGNTFKMDPYHLSPFSPDTRRILRGLYEDLAAHSLISGILFQDDACLSDEEDFNPLALKKFRELTGKKNAIPSADNPQWIALKTNAIDALLASLNDAVKVFRPNAKFARNIFSEAVLNPQSQAWLAQSYPDMLRHYDYVVIMAYPEMEKVKCPIPWLKALVSKVKKYPKGLKKTIFKLQTYDWQRERWIDSRVILKRLRRLEALGVMHLAYYPDNVFKNQPVLKLMRPEMSTREFSIAEYQRYIKHEQGK